MHAEVGHLSIGDMALHPRAYHRSVAAVCREEPREEASQLVGAGRVGSDRADPTGKGVHLVRALDRERARSKSSLFAKYK